MILYIQGFRSTTTSTKSKIFKEYFGDKLISINYSTIPKQGIEELDRLIKTKGVTKIIGSSLGGYYALYFAQKYNLKAVLINPSLAPFDTLKRHLGIVQNHEGKAFEWREEYLDSLKEFEITIPTSENYFLLLQKGDMTLDYKIAYNFFSESKKIVEEGGSHQFLGIERHFNEISEFLLGELKGKICTTS